MLCALCCGKHGKMAFTRQIVNVNEFDCNLSCRITFVLLEHFFHCCHRFFTISRLKWRMMTTFKIQFLFSATWFQVLLLLLCHIFQSFYGVLKEHKNLTRKSKMRVVNNVLRIATYAGRMKKFAKDWCKVGALMWFINYVNRGVFVLFRSPFYPSLSWEKHVFFRFQKYD